ncbi:MAG: serine/threonine protein kinase, partial [Deltaproteobacteria bacterium]|nr:serine/threonine protein kinase [Deltaproteobacteria bacterium]
MEASQFGKYRLLQHIASGGMAEIWLAEPLEAKTPQRLVIKIIRREHLERAEYRAMFLEEARLNAAVSHTNVVGVHERGEVDGVPFLVLEYVNGLDLRALLHTLAMHGAKLPLPIAVHIVREVALGMHAAHTAQDEQCRPLRLVHRDVCPHNILLGFEGQVKISDFGIAHGTDAASGSRPGQLTGRAGYLSPEQCAGLTIDHRTDIFSLGIVLYEATVGRRLFRGPSRIETQQMIKEARITPPTEVLPDYPKELEAIVLRALARAPEQRYATAEALARDLSLFLARTAEEVDQPELSSYLQTLAPAVQEAAEAREERSSSFITPLPAPGPAPDAGASNPPAADEAANDEDTPPAEEEAAAPPAPAEQMPVGPLRSPPPEPEKPAPPPKREPSQPLPAQRPMAASHSIPKL